MTTRDECEEAGCLLGWRGATLLSVSDDQCVYEDVARCFHASSLEGPGGALSAFWREIDGTTEVYLLSSFCDVEGLSPCRGGGEDPHPEDPAACACAGATFCD